MITLKWNSGPPPHIGWWRCNGINRLVHVWRWWNGRCWSYAAFPEDSPETAASWAAMRTARMGVKWCDYWPPGARVPRVDPRRMSNFGAAPVKFEGAAISYDTAQEAYKKTRR